MSIIETRFLVPIHEDGDIGNGELHPYYKWEELQRDLCTNFGGWTLYPGLFEGVYRDPDTGELIYDKSRMYIAALREKDLPRLRQYLGEKVAVRFRQKTIYFFNGAEVEFIESAKRQI